MNEADLLARERRARLAAERLLEVKQAELFDANRKLSAHARALSDEIIETREETQTLKDRTSQALTELETANTAVMIAEQRLWDSVETIRDGFAVFDRDEVMVAANSAYLAPFDGLESVGPGVSYPELLAIATEEGIVDIGEMPPADWITEMLARWRADPIPDRVIKLWSGHSLRLTERRGTTGDTVSLAIDMTQQVRYEARLKHARRRAEAASRAKSAFLANMSHEIRTPMNGVVGMADLLAETALDEEQRLFVETIKSSGEALLVLINDVLDYSKIDADKLTLQQVDFDLEQTIHEVVILMQPTLAGRGLDLVVDYDLFMPTHFRGDPGRIRQVLTNLIGNAVKFTPKGHVLVRVVGLPASEDAMRLHISIEDTGIGIEPEMAGHIFGEFNQVEDERNRAYEGTGLGLAITRRLIGLMGGEIWVDSEPGVGSCFGFHVTLTVAEDDAPPVQPMPAWVTRVLIADSQERGRIILEKQIAALGRETATARSLDELIACSPGPGDAILVDGALPGLDGADPTDRLRAAGFEGPVIRLAAAHTGGTPAGALARPIRRRELLAALGSLGAAPEAERRAVPEAPDTPERPMRVLAAEDNRTNRLVLSKLLRPLDIDLAFATNGREAVEAWTDQRPDLIFMDISMPEVDGKEATRQIRGLEAGGPRTPIVALTAHAMAGDAEAIVAAGLDAVLNKPLKKPEIVAAIDRHKPAGCRPILPAAEAPAASVVAQAAAGA